MPPTAWTRAYLVAAGAFAVLAGTLLALGADRTDTRFAWTIASDLTAAFLNGMYWAAAVFLLVCTRERSWASIQTAVVASALFMALLFVVMLLHFDQLHTDDSRFLVSWGAWGFLVSYVVLPAVALGVLANELRRPHEKRAGMQPMAPALRLLLAAQGTLAGVAGVSLLVLGTDAQSLWPWPLTPIGARAIASWVLAFGVISALAARDAGWRRLRPVVASYLALAALQALALARFGGEIGWSRPAAWIYLAALASFAAVALAGVNRWLSGRRGERAAAGSA